MNLNLFVSSNTCYLAYWKNSHFHRIISQLPLNEQNIVYAPIHVLNVVFKYLQVEFGVTEQSFNRANFLQHFFKTCKKRAESGSYE